MTNPATCKNCRLLEYQIRTRDAEITKLRQVLNEMDEHTGRGTPKWTVRGEDPRAKLTIAGPHNDAADGLYYRVVLQQESLTCGADVYGVDTAAWIAALNELGQETAWSQPRSMQSLEGNFQITWEHEDQLPRPLISWRIVLASDWNNPNWTIESWLQTRVDSLANTVSEGIKFFENTDKA